MEGSIQEKFSEYVIEWHPSRNGDITPDSVKSKSHKKRWWICSKGHAYEMSPNQKFGGKYVQGCPYCAGKRVWKGFNDLASQFPEIASEWDYASNDGLMPDMVIAKSGKKYWWKCPKCGASYYTRLSDRTIKGIKCPYCGPLKKKVVSGKTDLLTKYPEVAQLWDTEKNNNIEVSTISPNSHKSYWWRMGSYEWEESPNHLVQNFRKYGKILDREKLYREKRNEHIISYYGTSIPERTFLYYIKKVFPNSQNNYQFVGKKEIDIYLPDCKIGIEYDGCRFHGPRYVKKDLLKNRVCKEKGITLIRIREKGCGDLGDTCISISIKANPDKDDYKETIGALFNEISLIARKNYCSPDVDIEKDYDSIMSSIERYVIENSLAKANPSYLAEWDYERNDSLGIRPEYISVQSNTKVYWICNKGHKLHLSPSARFTSKGACGICSNKIVLKGYNDIETVNPDILKYWDYTKNKIRPSEVVEKSSIKVYWKCLRNPEHGSWLASIVDFTSGKTHCPKCQHVVVSKGETDLATQFPDLMEEWDYEKNKGIDPTEVLPNNRTSVWWIGKNCKHSYDMPIASRTRKKPYGCPYCAGKRLLKGFNDLASQYPNLLEEWDYERNEKSPDEYLAHSNTVVSWMCKKDNRHVWDAAISSRTGKAGSSCPVCHGLKIIPGVNDLESQYPDIAKEWDYEKNIDESGNFIFPSTISAHAQKKYWWIGSSCGHSWDMRVDSRVTQNQNCPYCSGRRVLKGFNDFPTLYPDVLKLWDYDKNGDLDPYSFSKGSSRLVWWIDKDYQVSIKSRIWQFENKKVKG